MIITKITTMTVIVTVTITTITTVAITITTIITTIVITPARKRQGLPLFQNETIIPLLYPAGEVEPAC